MDDADSDNYPIDYIIISISIIIIVSILIYFIWKYKWKYYKGTYTPITTYSNIKIGRKNTQLNHNPYKHKK